MRKRSGPSPAPLPGFLVACGMVLACVMGVPLLMFAALAGFLVTEYARTTSYVGVVDGHHWRRSVVVEQYGGVGPSPLGRLPRHSYHHSSGSSSHVPSPWVRVDELVLEGDDQNPVWPVAPDDHCSTRGCRRPGAGREVYQIVGKRADGLPFTCEVDKNAWPLYIAGAEATVSVSGLIGWVRCGPPQPG